MQVEFARGLGPPQAHVDHVVVVEPRHEQVAGHGHDDLGVGPAGAVAAVLVGRGGDVAVELHRVHERGPFVHPRRAEPQPAVRGLDLVAVDDLLVEQAEVIADAVAVGRNLHGGDGIHEAGGQPAEAAVAQGRVFLALLQGLQVVAELLQGLGDLVHQPHVDDGVAQRAADEKLERQVVHPFHLLGVEGLLGLDPLFHEHVAQGIGERPVDVLVAGAVRVAALEAHQVVLNALFELLDPHVPENGVIGMVTGRGGCLCAHGQISSEGGVGGVCSRLPVLYRIKPSWANQVCGADRRTGQDRRGGRGGGGAGMVCAETRRQRWGWPEKRKPAVGDDCGCSLKMVPKRRLELPLGNPN